MISVIGIRTNKETGQLLQVAWGAVVFQENAVLNGLVIAFDLTLRWWVERRATKIFHLVLLHPLSQFTRV